MTKSALKAVNLFYDYPDGAVALRDLNLDIAVGGSLAVIGPNGAGKSSLLLCLLGLLPARGDIYILGEKLTPANVVRLRRRAAMVFQDPDDQLFMPTLAEDIAFGPANLGLTQLVIQQRVDAVLAQLDLTSKRDRPPHHLSFGEKRRAALATALAMQAEILLLDEPTSNLDAATVQELTTYLAKFPGTLVVATHDLSLAKNLCRNCLLLAEGQMVAAGETETILSDTARLQRFRLIGR